MLPDAISKGFSGRAELRSLPRRSALAGRVCLSGLRGKRLGMRRGRAHTFECLACGRQTSITSSTALHRSKCPLQMWFWAEHLATTHSNGMTDSNSLRNLASSTGRLGFWRRGSVARWLIRTVPFWREWLKSIRPRFCSGRQSLRPWKGRKDRYCRSCRSGGQDRH